MQEPEVGQSPSFMQVRVQSPLAIPKPLLMSLSLGLLHRRPAPQTASDVHAAPKFAAPASGGLVVPVSGWG
jgi:hypothetical protein